MLLWNINISIGLVNGSTGIVKDFIFCENIHAPSLPTAIIIEFSDYSGPPTSLELVKKNGYPFIQKHRNGDGPGKKITLGL